MEEQETVYLNPHEDRIIGVIGEHMYFKPEHREYIVVTTEKEYLNILKRWIAAKRNYCERNNHFCGVFGELNAKKYERIKDIVLNEYFDVEDDGKNDGLEMRQIPYPTYLVDEFEKHVDMEHG